jgi:predicted DNA binding protein
MRALTVLLAPPADSHLAYRLFGPDTGLVRERIYHLNVLEDGSIVLLGRIRGDLTRAEQFITAHPDVVGYSVSETSPDGGLVYVHARPPAAMVDLLDLPSRHEVFFEFPIEGTDDGRLRVVMVGETNEVLQRALADVPEAVGVTVERIGPYSEAGAVLAVLTERQREVLDVARELGYYEVPRRATHREIAEELGLSVGTVGEHLQKMEARVFDALG